MRRQRTTVIGIALALAPLVAGCGTGTQAAGRPAPAPLPDGLHQVATSAMVGRWTPSGSTPSGGPAFLQLAANGAWQSSDGCNTTTGRWTIDQDSRVQVTAGPSTEIGCANVDIGGWWARTARVGTDGADLVLLDRAGVVLATLSRTPDRMLMTHGPAAPR
ncbi:META domain-containing protein [Angustibacter sp. McL0619]|uniref:META domain-containing protein n=1 Tax=Angustibacter sp. McL0619 TaxID=3415676 RepID=UPI003CF22EAF